MKNRILVSLLSVTLLFVSGCGAQVESVGNNEKSMFVRVEHNSMWVVVYQKDTKVMYAVSNYGGGSGVFTVLLNPDGTPMIYDEDWNEEK